MMVLARSMRDGAYGVRAVEALTSLELREIEDKTDLSFVHDA
jgi:hypothetical protein